MRRSLLAGTTYALANPDCYRLVQDFLVDHNSGLEVHDVLRLTLKCPTKDREVTTAIRPKQLDDLMVKMLAHRHADYRKAKAAARAISDEDKGGTSAAPGARREDQHLPCSSQRGSLCGPQEDHPTGPTSTSAPITEASMDNPFARLCAKAGHLEHSQWNSLYNCVDNGSEEGNVPRRSNFTQEQLEVIRDDLHVAMDKAFITAEADLEEALVKQDAQLFLQIWSEVVENSIFGFHKHWTQRSSAIPGAWHHQGANDSHTSFRQLRCS